MSQRRAGGHRARRPGATGAAAAPRLRKPDNARVDTEAVSGPAPATLTRLMAAAEGWAPTTARVLLGLVLAWFGYHELVNPGLWTGYVPVLPASSHVAEVLVLAHGWVLLVLAVSLVAGIAPRLAAAIAFVLVLEIVISLTAKGGLSDIVLRDVGVLGLCAAVVGSGQQRLLLRR